MVLSEFNNNCLASINLRVSIISETLLERFKKSHAVQIINNSNVDYSKLEGMDHITAGERAFAVYEHRGGLHQNIFMEWAFFTPKNTSNVGNN